MPAAPKPTDDIAWHPTDGDVVVEPANEDRERGYLEDDEPASGWFNWKFDRLSLWQEHLRDVFPWANFGDIGVSNLADLAAALTARFILPLAANATSVRTKIKQIGIFAVGEIILWGCNPADAGGKVFEVSVNADWDGTVWSRTIGALDSALYRFGFDGTFRAAYRDGGAADDWADSYAGSAGSGTGWTTHFQVGQSSATLPGTTTLNGALNVNGNLVVDGIAAINEVQVADTIGGASGGTLTTTADLVAQGDVTADDVDAEDVACASVTATDSIQSLGTMHGASLTVDNNGSVAGTMTMGTVAASNGLLTTEHVLSLTGYTGPTAEDLFHCLNASASTVSTRLYRWRAGKLIRAYAAASADAGAGQPIRLTVKKSGVTVASALIAAATHLADSGALAESHVANNYYTVEATTEGSGGTQGPLDLKVVLVFQE